MAKTAVISARIDPKVKCEAEEVFEKLGLTAEQAITLFYEQVELNGALPFTVRVPDDVTVEALQQARAREETDAFNSLNDLFRDLGI